MTDYQFNVGDRVMVKSCVKSFYAGCETTCSSVDVNNRNVLLIFDCCGYWYGFNEVDLIKPITKKIDKPMKTTNDSFYLVWCPTGRTSPSYRHKYKSQAVEEAKRLAKTNPGSEFFVLETKYSAVFGKCDEKDYSPPKEPDQIPF